MPTLAQNALRFEDLELAPGGRRLAPPLTFEIPRGRLVALCGENGSGKTTLLRQLLRLSPLPRGRLFDQSFSKKAYVPQSTDLGVGWPLTVREALALSPASKENKEAKEALLWTLRITPLLVRRFAALSGGERQKVLCARALLSAPDLLCLDEPTSGVDAEAAEILWQRFAKLAHDHHAVVIVISHQSELIQKHADVVLHLNADGLHL